MAKKPSTPSTKPSKPSTTPITSNTGNTSNTKPPTSAHPSLTSTSSSSSKPNLPPPSSSSSSSSSTLTSRSTATEIAQHIWTEYRQNTPARTFLLDAFMAFLVASGILQFLYAILFGNYPFNAFLSGFSAAVGQFVLTASLRMQTIEKLPVTASADARKAANAVAVAAAAARKKSGGGGGGAEAAMGQEEDDGRPRVSSSERAFADYVFGSLILHAFCVNFIN